MFWLFAYINEVWNAIRENDKLFGGMQVLIFGDLIQLPPICIEEYGKFSASIVWHGKN